MLKKILFFVAVTAILFSVYDFYVETYETRNNAETLFVIANGDNIYDISTQLAQKNILSSRTPFLYYAWKKKLRGKMIAGTYQIPPHTSLATLAHIFASGDTKKQDRPQVKVTIPEGLTISEMGDVLEAAHLPGHDVVALANNPSQQLRELFDFVPREGGLEGYLFPDTYQFFTDANAFDIIKKMLQNFDRRFPQTLRAQVEKTGHSLHEIITLASLVEGEAREDRDRPIIAGIFYNRLAQGMPLQSDATIDYITGNAQVKHTLADIDIDSPYNTYKYPGLPPGPVNAPSLKSLMATLHPQETDYVFFLHNAQTGETVYAKTFQEHIDNKTQNGL